MVWGSERTKRRARRAAGAFGIYVAIMFAYACAEAVGIFSDGNFTLTWSLILLPFVGGIVALAALAAWDWFQERRSVLPRAGWYRDPNTGDLRWWDGNQWGESQHQEGVRWTPTDLGK